LKCLVCKNIELEESELSQGLKVNHCNTCGGNWLRFGDYLEWFSHHDIATDEADPATSHLQVNDSTNPKVCPDCGKILSVYKIANNLNFRLDHCVSCNGIWFDRNEWESLKENHLHDKINKFFTDSWQKNLREEEIKEHFVSFYKSKFGDEDFEKIKGVKEWLEHNENRSMLLAFLTNNNPYKL
jgi:Zn-finger nucleic acid-binding protein